MSTPFPSLTLLPLDDSSTNWRGPWSADEQQALNDAIVIDNNQYVCRLVEESGVCTIPPCNCDFWRHAGPVPVAEVAAVGEESVADEEAPPTKNTAELDAQEAAADAPASVTDVPVAEPPVPSKKFCGPWSADVQQHVNDVILIDGSYYICRQVEASGFCTIPPCNCDFWTQSGPAPSSEIPPLNDPTTVWRGVWSAETQYVLNDAIVIDNNYYVCRLVEASGVCTIPPCNCDFWRHAGPVPTGEEPKPCDVTPLANPDTTWRGQWDQYAKYSVNDAVVHENTYFICRQTDADGFCTALPCNIDYWTVAGAVSVSVADAPTAEAPTTESTTAEAPAESTETPASVDASATSDVVTDLSGNEVAAEPAKPKSFEEMLAEKLYPPGTVMKDASGNDFVLQPGDKVTITPGSFKLNMDGCKLQ